MAFHLGDDDGLGVNEMNLIPLIDIMLVLMIIFLVTATVMNPAVPLNLPKTSASVPELPPRVIQVSIDKDANLFWDAKAISIDDLDTLFVAESKKKGDEPTINLRADKDSRYDTVAKVLSSASSAGLSKIAFVNE